ncbi:uncharacterized protein LOC126815312 [Patella vulgata]|uniref:uncharacterized protein LOC126815312 n=1 Tax=Patella vulgata TaxID=6465 RepID=UPI00217F3284|nr:uncharacterized protein LOC126815312 [Patella vulgata]
MNKVKCVETKAKQREELTFKPNINQSDHMFTVYTGLTKQDIRNNKLNLEQSVDSEKVDTSGVTPSVTASPPVSSVSPGHKKEYILTRREAKAYINMHTAYNNADTKKQRKAKLIDRLSEAQLAYIKQHNEMLKLKEKQKQESKIRQQKQLSYLRRKFEKDQWRRFRSQYVTNKIVEHELMNRNEYGLPQELDEDVQYGAKLKRKKQKPIKNVNKDELRKRNAKKYEKMFIAYNNSSAYKCEKVPKMEGIDTIVVSEKDKNGQMVEKKKMVSDVIKEAEREIKSSNQQKDDENTTKTPQPNTKKRTPSPKSSHDRDALNISLDSLDLDEDDDEDDIFERARKKYGLDIDSSLDTNSLDHR